jgi:hypothetical protein
MFLPFCKDLPQPGGPELYVGRLQICVISVKLCQLENSQCLFLLAHENTFSIVSLPMLSCDFIVHVAVFDISLSLIQLHTLHMLTCNIFCVCLL